MPVHCAEAEVEEVSRSQFRREILERSNGKKSIYFKIVEPKHCLSTILILLWKYPPAFFCAQAREMNKERVLSVFCSQLIL